MNESPATDLPPMRERLRTDYGWTERQRQVLDLLREGRSNGEIAERLGVSLAGAKWHVSEILSKLNADSREEAAEYWRHYNGLAPRFGRVFHAMAGLQVAKGMLVAGGSAAVAAGAAGAVVLFGAVRDGGPAVDSAAGVSETASPSPTATWTASPPGTPMPTATPTITPAATPSPSPAGSPGASARAVTVNVLLGGGPCIQVLVEAEVRLTAPGYDRTITQTIGSPCTDFKVGFSGVPEGNYAVSGRVDRSQVCAVTSSEDVVACAAVKPMSGDGGPAVDGVTGVSETASPSPTATWTASPPGTPTPTATLTLAPTATPSPTPTGSPEASTRTVTVNVLLGGGACIQIPVEAEVRLTAPGYDRTIFQTIQSPCTDFKVGFSGVPEGSYTVSGRVERSQVCTVTSSADVEACAAVKPMPGVDSGR